MTRSFAPILWGLWIIDATEISMYTHNVWNQLQEHSFIELVTYKFIIIIPNQFCNILYCHCCVANGKQSDEKKER